jgi:hypothetical protein
MISVSAALRRAVRRRAANRCEYCQTCAEFTGHDLTLDHILPRSAGGKTRFENLCWCCFWCNSFKQARSEAVDSQTKRLVPLFHPRRDRWETHFRWSSDGARIIGRTPSGRATVKALRLNRPVLVRARRIWVRHGYHPPEIQRQKQ